METTIQPGTKATPEPRNKSAAYYHLRLVYTDRHDGTPLTPEDRALVESGLRTLRKVLKGRCLDMSWGRPE
ncbi:MAG: hypothetical protein HYT80_00490 [Euryarchaeota archaeon]|nr:hypothetical protein [Euryarchaeota archaeon]